MIIRGWTEEHAKLPTAAVALVYVDEKFLLVQRGPNCAAAGYWAPVSGKVEELESTCQTAERELYEEVGLKGEAKLEVGRSITRCERYQLHWWYIDVSKPLSLKLNDEVSQAQWCTFQQLFKISPFFSEDLPIFEAFQKQMLHGLSV